MRLSARELDDRVARLAELLPRDGDVSLATSERGQVPFQMDARIKAPGGAAGHDMSFRYYEGYAWDGVAWELAEYVYLMSWQTGQGQLEHHWHAFLWSGGETIYHLHCTPSGGARGHFRDHLVFLDEARDEFRRRYAADESIDCSPYYPLDASRA